MDISLKKTIYTEKTDKDTNQIIFYIFSLSIVFFLLGSTINHFSPEYDDKKEIMIQIGEFIMGTILLVCIYVWFYLLTARVFKISFGKLHENYLLVIGLSVVFFCIFLITQSKYIQKVRLLADTLWTPTPTTTTVPEKQEEEEPSKSSKKKQKRRETNIREILPQPQQQISNNIYQPKNDLMPQTQHNDIYINEYNSVDIQQPIQRYPENYVDYGQSSSQQDDDQVPSYMQYNKLADRENKNNYLYGRQTVPQHIQGPAVAIEPMSTYSNQTGYDSYGEVGGY